MMQTSSRRIYIDVLRVVGTLLVFLFHCTQPFNPNDEWHIRNAEQSKALGYMIDFFNIWIMPLFTFLAGSSAYFALRKRSSAQFAKERVLRIFVPLVLGILIFVAPQVYTERVFRGEFTGNFLTFYPHFFDGIYPEGNFSWHHLWFLVYLFFYSIVAIPIFYLLQLAKDKAFLSGFYAQMRKPYRLLLFAIPLFLGHLLFWYFPQTNALVNDWAWHAQLFLPFIFGYIFVSDSELEMNIQKHWKAYLYLALFLSVVVFWLREIPRPEDPTQKWLLFAGKGIVYRTCTWTWILAFLGISQKYLDQDFLGLDRASEAAFPFYIIHQTVIVILAAIIVQSSGPLFEKYALLLFSALLGTSIIYEMARRFRISRFILGMK